MKQNNTKYRVIVKASPGSDGKFVKYRVTNLLKFTEFLDKNYPKWTWMNVFNYNTGDQITSYTCRNRPTSTRPP